MLDYSYISELVTRAKLCNWTTFQFATKAPAFSKWCDEAKVRLAVCLFKLVFFTSAQAFMGGGRTTLSGQETMWCVRDVWGRQFWARWDGDISASQLQSMHYLSCYSLAVLYMMVMLRFLWTASQYAPNHWCKLKITFKKVICNSDNFRELI